MDRFASLGRTEGAGAAEGVACYQGDGWEGEVEEEGEEGEEAGGVGGGVGVGFVEFEALVVVLGIEYGGLGRVKMGSGFSANGVWRERKMRIPILIFDDSSFVFFVRTNGLFVLLGFSSSIHYRDRKNQKIQLTVHQNFASFPLVITAPSLSGPRVVLTRLKAAISFWQ